MTDNELLMSISNLMDKKLKPIESRMDSIEQKIDTVEKNLNAKIDNVEENLTNRINNVENGLKAEINRLDTSIHMINLKLENIIEPRLYEIEDCYLSTYERYKIGNEKFDKIEMDISILQSVMKEHSIKLQAQSA